MKRYYSDPNKTSVAMAPSGETKEIHSFRKYTLGKNKEFLRITEMEFLDISHSLTTKGFYFPLRKTPDRKPYTNQNQKCRKQENSSLR
jgi:hypothetical protein